DSVDLRSAEITRGGPVDASATLLTNLIAGLVEEAGAAVAGEHAGIHGVKVHGGAAVSASASIDLECPRD
ncbi:MAG: hypothetical protein V2J24_21695, partial [Pseudomonadales bacterium]|nr:hypothetical protein [Pseudomonadales bacterium]